MMRIPARLPSWLALLVAGTFFAAANAQTVSDWLPAGADVDWYEAAHWSSGIPQEPGDQANVFSLNRSTASPVISTPLALGHLSFNGTPRSTARVLGTAVLTFDQPGDAPAVLTVNPDFAPQLAILATPFGIADAQGLEIQVPGDDVIRIESPVASTGGSIRKTGDGPLAWTTPSPSWNGTLSVVAGRLLVEHPDPLTGPAGNVGVHSDAVVSFTQSSAAPVTLAGGTMEFVSAEHSGGVALQGTGRLVHPASSVDTPATLSSSIWGNGDLVLENNSNWHLTITGNSTYTGRTVLERGNYHIRSSNALGSGDEGTTIRGGETYLFAPSDEAFRVEGGTLSIDTPAFIPTKPFVLAGGTVVMPEIAIYDQPVVLEGPGGKVQFNYFSQTSFTGGSTGTGDLRIGTRVQIDAPLAHDGDLIVDGPTRGATFNVANTYTGDTYILETSEVNHPQAFGTATTPIVVDGADLVLHVTPAGGRGFDVLSGRLQVNSATPVEGTVRLGGNFDATVTGHGVFHGPVEYNIASPSHRVFVSGGTFHGPIRGTELLHLGGSDGVTLNAANAIEGGARVTGGRVVVNHADALHLSSTHLEGGVVDFHVPVNGMPFMTRYPFGSQPPTGTLRLHADQETDDSWYIDAGTLETTANLQLNHLLLYAAAVNVLDGGSLQLDDELLLLRTSHVAGKLTGRGNIRAVGTSSSIQGDLTEFAGDIFVENGTLTLGADTELGSSDIHVRGSGRLQFEDYFTPAVEISNTIYLHNDKLAVGGGMAGMHYDAYGGGPLTLTGRLDVGDQGGSIVGSGDIHIQGSITGHQLKLRDSSIVIEAPQSQLDVLRLDNSAISIERAGELSGMDGIDLQRSSIFLGANTATDRIDDAIAIHSNHSLISLLSSSATTTSETLGTLHVDRGYTSVFASSDHGSLQATLTFHRIERQPATLLLFEEAGRVTSTRIHSIDSFDSHMIGGWAYMDQGFASIDSQGFVGTLQATSTDINTATAADHVAAPGPQALTADREIASLVNAPQGSPYSLDLRGHRLSVRSGGIFRSGDIVNGELTAGDGGPAELILPNTRRVDADIVDNGDDGSLALIATGQYAMTLAGTNTYSGGTWVVGNHLPYYPDRPTLRIEGLQAIPEKDRVMLEFGTYEVRLTEPGVVQLDELHLRTSSYVTGVNAELDAETYFLEQGTITLPLTGQGVMYKDSAGTVDFSTTKSPNYTGDVYVRDGRLSLESQTMPAASLLVTGGVLEVEGTRLLTNDVLLGGGALQGNFSGNVHVASDSELHEHGMTTLRGQLTGDAHLTIRGSLDDRFATHYVALFGDASEFTGDLIVESGALRLGAPTELGDGEIVVQAGARLILGRDRLHTAPTVVSRDIHLYSGVLYATPDAIESGDVPDSLTTGDVYVHGTAIIGASGRGQLNGVEVPGLTLAGRVLLDDRATVFGLAGTNSLAYSSGRTLVEVAGELLVGEQNVWQLGEASMAVSGMLRPNTTHASIDFQGIPSALVFDGATFQTEAGRSLSVSINGAPQALPLAGADTSLTGNGTLGGSFRLEDGASVAPGNSPGTLTIDGHLTLGGEAVYKWEVGAGGWDQLVVDGRLAFAATPEAPWVLEIVDLDQSLLVENAAWRVASATEIEGFDPTAVALVADHLNVAFERSMADRFALEQRGNELFLTLTVPEPASFAIIGCLCGATLLARGGVGRRRAQRT